MKFSSDDVPVLGGTMKVVTRDDVPSDTLYFLPPVHPERDDTQGITLELAPGQWVNPRGFGAIRDVRR